MRRVSMQAARLVLGLGLVIASGAARADGDAARGEKRFEECAACHSVERGVNNVGPSLAGIFTRKAGELPDFRYSPAMKRSGIAWSPDTLDSFVGDPQKLVPANRMPYAGMADAGARADLIAYLRAAAK
jgi:cytochrome c2